MHVQDLSKTHPCDSTAYRTLHLYIKLNFYLLQESYILREVQTKLGIK
jgi:hypothetical protein